MPKTLFQDEELFTELHRLLFEARLKVSQLEDCGFAPGISQSEIRHMETRLFDSSTSAEERPIQVGDQVTSFGHKRTIGGSACNGEILTVEETPNETRIVVNWFFPDNIAEKQEEIKGPDEPRYGCYNAVFFYSGGTP